ncbi:restriction endonuclease subunit S [Streptomyces sp. SAI-229]|uniref:restriction endonuclease subunit S n=1 Tax=Streptomyces sp. SAI-229 TaxID=3377731 RepID=UPI003C798702
MTLGLDTAVGDGAESLPRKLPVGWTMATLGELCEPVRKVVPHELGRPTFVYVDIGSIDSIKHIVSSPAEIAVGKAPSRARQLLQEGDTVFSTVRPYLRKIAYVSEELDGEVASTGFCVLRPGKALHPRYLFWIATSGRFVAEVTGKQRGASYPAVRNQDIFEMEIAVPPLAEQRRIAAAVDQNAAHIEAGERAVAAAIERAVDLASSIADSSIARLSDAPTVKLGEMLCEPLRNGVSAKPAIDGKGVRTLTLTAVTRNNFSDEFTKITSADPNKVKNLWLEDQDIFVQRSNSADLVGTSAIYRGVSGWAIYPDLLIRVRVRRDQSLPEYVALVLRTSRVLRYFRQNARGLSGSMPKIDQATIENVEFPLPSLRRQMETVEWAVQQEAALEPILTSINEARTGSAKLRAALLYAASTGALVPQNPADEPASILLDRIRAEQGAKAPRKRAARKPRSVPLGQEELPS